MKEKIAGSRIKGMTVVHTNIPDRAQKFAERVRAEFDHDGEIIINELGSDIAVHFGPGLLGLIAYGE